MHIFGVSLFLLLLATLLAIVEIEAEGKYGWAEKFPTWYSTRPMIAKIFKYMTSKTLTGYHAALLPTVYMVFIWPMVASATFSLSGVLSATAQYMGFLVVWDFCWFVLNPHYGVQNFRPNKVWWFSHESWLFGRIPFSYISSLGTACVFSALSGAVHGGWLNRAIMQGQQFGYYIIGVIVLQTVCKPLYHKYYEAMRTHDERDSAGIFH